MEEKEFDCVDYNHPFICEMCQNKSGSWMPPRIHLSRTIEGLLKEEGYDAHCKILCRGCAQKIMDKMDEEYPLTPYAPRSVEDMSPLLVELYNKLGQALPDGKPVPRKRYASDFNSLFFVRKSLETPYYITFGGFQLDVLYEAERNLLHEFVKQTIEEGITDKIIDKIDGISK